MIPTLSKVRTPLLLSLWLLDPSSASVGRRFSSDLRRDLPQAEHAGATHQAALRHSGEDQQLSKVPGHALHAVLPR